MGAVCLLVVAITGCSGGATNGNGTQAGTGDGAGEGAGGGGAGGGGAAQGSGKSFFFTFAGQAMHVDLATGTTIGTELTSDSDERLGMGGGLLTDVENDNTYEYTIVKRTFEDGTFKIDGRLPTMTIDGRLIGAAAPSPDGKRFAIYTSESKELGDPDIDYVTVIDAKLDVKARVAGVRFPVWLDDETLVASSEDGLFLVSATGAGTPKRIGEAGLGGVDGGPTQLALSPDHRAVAFFHGDAIWRIDLDGTNLTQLTLQSSSQAWPAWSPDGASIAVQSGVCSWTTSAEERVVSATAAKQDLKDAPSLQHTIDDGRSVPIRACGPAYWR